MKRALSCLALLCFVGCEGTSRGPDASLDDDAGTVFELDDAGRPSEVKVTFDEDFGLVLRGQFVDHTATFTNLTSRAVTVRLAVDPGRFELIGASQLELGPRASKSAVVRFTPLVFGAATTTLTLTIDGVPSQGTLTGSGIGPRLSIPSSIDFGAIPVFATAAADEHRSMTISNTGSGAPGHLSIEVLALEGDPSELCVSGCFSGVTSIPLGAPTELDLRLVARRPGKRHYELRLFTNDVDASLITVDVFADVVATPTCVYGVPSRLDFGVISDGEVRRLEYVFENFGTEPCVVTGAALTSPSPLLPRPAFELEPTAFPIRLEPGEATRLLIRATGQRLRFEHTMELSLSVNAPERRTRGLVAMQLEPSCLIAGLTRPLDFGQVEPGCASTPLTIDLHAASECLVLGSVSVSSVLPPGPNFQLLPGPSPQVRFTPTRVGPFRDVLFVNWERRGEVRQTTIELMGEGVAPGPRVDRRVLPTKLDLLVVVDDTTGMAPHLPSLNTRLQPLLTDLLQRGVDFHLGVTSGDAESPEVGRLKRTTTDDAYLTSTTPDVGQRFAELLDFSGHRPANDCAIAALRTLTFPRRGDSLLGQTGFRRDDAALSVLCITSHPPARSTSELQLVELRAPFDVIGPIGVNDELNCRTSNPDPSHFSELAQATGGQRLDLCASDWSPLLETIVERARHTTRLPLSGTLADGGTIDVTINTQPLTPSGSWTWDSPSRSVIFAPLVAPLPGDSVALTYPAVCQP